MAKNQAKMQMVDDDEVENVGIMSGFMDDIEELMEEIAQQEMAGEGDDADMARILGRSPDSPEVLMNNLRGDYRSIDARREELADRVGYNAAQQTPDEVLAMLQPVFAQQGVAALPMGGADMGPLPMDALTGMPPPGGMPPAAMPMDPAMMGAPPAGMPPMDPAMMAPEGIASLPMDQGAMPPMQMARGGIVQHFERGGAAASATDSISPIDEYLTQRPQAAIDPMVRTRELTPEYQELLGISDRGATQAQMLFDIAQAALGYASNVGPDGQPLSGSGAARLAGATRALPGQIGARAAAMKDDETRARLAALQQAQSEREAAIASNTALSSDQRAILLAREKQAADMALEREKRQELPDSIQALNYRADQAGLASGTPERAAFMLRGGVQDTASRANLQRVPASVNNGPSEFVLFAPDSGKYFRNVSGNLEEITDPVKPAIEFMRDPVTGAVYKLDPLSGMADRVTQRVPDEPNQTAVFKFMSEDLSFDPGAGTGAGSAFINAWNNTIGQLPLAPVGETTSAAMQTLRNLERKSVDALKLSSRPPIFEQEKIGELVPDPGAVFQNPNLATNRIVDFINMMGDQYVNDMRYATDINNENNEARITSLSRARAFKSIINDVITPEASASFFEALDTFEGGTARVMDMSDQEFNDLQRSGFSGLTAQQLDAAEARIRNQ
jgi:hypothetical protein